jgi:hypothetical protein
MKELHPVISWLYTRNSKKGRRVYFELNPGLYHPIIGFSILLRNKRHGIYSIYLFDFNWKEISFDTPIITLCSFREIKEFLKDYKNA